MLRDLFSRSWVRGILSICISTCCKESGEAEARFSSVVPRNRTTGNEHKIKYIYCVCSIGTSGNTFTMRVTQHWNRVVVESPSLEVFNSLLNMVSKVMWARWSPEVPFSLNYSVIPWLCDLTYLSLFIFHKCWVLLKASLWKTAH